MADNELTSEDTTPAIPDTGLFAGVKRISWAAVFAGVVVVLVVQLTLALLGLGIGASTIDPLSEANPTAGIGLGSGIWLAVSTLIALYAGGWVAGRVAGMARRSDGALHGVLTWGLATLTITYALSSAVTGVVGGTVAALGKAATVVGQGMSAAAPQIAEAVQKGLAETGLDLSAIKDEAADILRQTGKPQLQPGQLEAEAGRIAETARQGAATAARAPQTAEAELGAVIDRIFREGRVTLAAADREALVNVLTARTSMTRAEAATTVDRWQQMAQSAQAKLVEARARAEQEAREAADAAAKAIARGALWSFVALVLGGIAAALGAFQGTPRDLRPVAPRPRPSRAAVGGPAYQS